jgi:hypothetical protein
MAEDIDYLILKPIIVIDPEELWRTLRSLFLHGCCLPLQLYLFGLVPHRTLTLGDQAGRSHLFLRCCVGRLHFLLRLTTVLLEVFLALGSVADGRRRLRKVVVDVQVDRLVGDQVRHVVLRDGLGCGRVLLCLLVGSGNDTDCGSGTRPFLSHLGVRLGVCPSAHIIESQILLCVRHRQQPLRRGLLANAPLTMLLCQQLLLK